MVEEGMEGGSKGIGKTIGFNHFGASTEKMKVPL